MDLDILLGEKMAYAVHYDITAGRGLVGRWPQRRRDHPNICTNLEGVLATSPCF